MQNARSSGSKIVQSIGVHASNIKNSDSENEDHLLRVSGSKDLRLPARPLNRNEIDLDATMCND